MDGHKAYRTFGAGFGAALVVAAMTGQAVAQPRCGHGVRIGDRAATEVSVAALDEGARAAIEEALADERRTEAVYQAVIAKLGEVRPFSHAVHAEARHAGFLEERLSARGLSVPPRTAKTGPPPPATLKGACEAAVVAERANVALYDRLLADGRLPDDVKRAFEHNRRASLEHHVPAFERCVAGRGAGAATRGGGPGHGPGSSTCRGGACGRRGGAGAGRGDGAGCGGCCGHGPAATGRLAPGDGA